RELLPSGEFLQDHLCFWPSIDQNDPQADLLARHLLAAEQRKARLGLHAVSVARLMAAGHLRRKSRRLGLSGERSRLTSLAWPYSRTFQISLALSNNGPVALDYLDWNAL